MEEYDSEVHCDECSPPGQIVAKKKAAAPAAKASAPGQHAVQFHAANGRASEGLARHEARAKAATKAQDKAEGWYTPPPSEEVAKYGPENCVKTYKTEERHCVVQTECKGIDITDVDFGVVCVDNIGKPVRHLFGKGSFDPEETFDTLILCDQCLGLTDVPADIMMNNEVLGLSKEVKDLGGIMKNITASISTLNTEVFAPAPAPAPVAVAAAAPAAVALHGKQQKKHVQQKKVAKHLRGEQKQRQQQVVEDDEDEQQEEDAYVDDGASQIRLRREAMEKAETEATPAETGAEAEPASQEEEQQSDDSTELAAEEDMSPVDDGFSD